MFEDDLKKISNMNHQILAKSFFYISAFLLKFALIAAIIPHQGRITVENQPFNGVGHFKFALVDQTGKIRWDHENSGGIPQESISIPVNQGFYHCKLGDISFPGMEPLADDLFTYDDPLSLRIWFSENGVELKQLGPDQPLLVAPYATATPWTKTDETASLLSEELIEQAIDNDTTSLSLIERMVSLGSNTLVSNDFNGSISLAMLDDDVHLKIASLEGNNSKQDNDIISVNQKLEIHTNKAIEREDLASELISELDSLALIDLSFEDRINQSEEQIISLTGGQSVNSDDIQNIENNITQIQSEIIKANQDLTNYKSTLIKRVQFDNTLILELDGISALNGEQQTRLSDLENNITNLSNKEIARQIQLDSFEDDLSGFNSKHQDQSKQIVDMERDLALHNTKDVVQDSYIDAINDDIIILKADDENTDTEIESLQNDITSILVKDVIQDANLTKNKSNISNLSNDLKNLDGNFFDFKLLVEKYLKPEILNQPVVSNSTGPIDANAGDAILIEMEGTGKFLTYQWYLAKSTFGVNGDLEYEDFIQIPNANSRTHEIPQANASDDEGLYRVVVSNEFGEITSDEILINIL